ncbi:MAG TPA: choice-of-anchor Q domain-containing protein [Thermoleophilaceae bacterium]|jgi:hypothetical protein|nr:choice-of-anchor Q domain-containing protein [Thermoleophilaceae bacterium]
MFNTRAALLAVLVASACFGAPSLAGAADLCVNDSACLQAGGTSAPTLDGALTAAESGSSADRIFLGPGTYKATAYTGFSAPNYPVEIIGAGPTATTLTAPVNASPVLKLGSVGSSVSDLSIEIPASNDLLPKTGLDLTGGTARHVGISYDNNAYPNSNGVQLHGGLLEDSTVSVPSGGGAAAVVAYTDARVYTSDLTGPQGVAIVGADVQVDRVHITSALRGIFETRLNGRVTNSVIHPVGNSTAVLAADQGSSDITMTLRNVTIAGDGGTSTGIALTATVGHTITAIVDSSVIRGVQDAFRRSANPGTANIGVEYSDFDPSATYSSGPGVLANGAGNINSDPLFAGATDFHPLSGSPLVDAGNPASSNDTLDLDGNPRVAGGGRDIGAYELQPPAPTADPVAGGSAPVSPPADPGPAVAVKDTLAPVITGLKIAPARFTARHGARINFKLSERATVVVTVKRRAAHGSRLTKVATLRRTEPAGTSRISMKRRLGRVALRPGRYVATVSAVDGAGNRSRGSRLTFQVLAR